MTNNDRSHLTKKPITDRNGKQTTVYVNQNKGTGEANAGKLSGLTTQTALKKNSEKLDGFTKHIDSIIHADCDGMMSEYSKKSDEFEGTVQYSQVTPREFDDFMNALREDDRTKWQAAGSIEGSLVDDEFFDAQYTDESGEEHEFSIYARESYSNQWSSDYTVFITDSEKTANKWSDMVSEELDRIDSWD